MGADGMGGNTVKARTSQDTIANGLYCIPLSPYKAIKAQVGHFQGREEKKV